MQQWPGNGTDLDFRGVIQRSVAIMAVAPVEGKLTKSDDKGVSLMAKFNTRPFWEVKKTAASHS